MATVTVTKALNSYFNSGDGKRPAQDFLRELRELSTEEKLALAQEIVKVNGDTLAE